MNGQLVSRLFFFVCLLAMTSCQKPEAKNQNGKAQNVPDNDSQIGELNQALAKWNKNGPAAYRFRYRNPSSGVRENRWLLQELEIVVINQKPVSVLRLDSKEYHWNPSEFPSIDSLFEKVELALKSNEDVQVEYDSELGWPKFVDVGSIEADSGFQIQINFFEQLEVDIALKNLTQSSELADPRANFHGLIPFPLKAPKDVVDWLETERQTRNGVVCIWNIKSGKPIFYGGRGDRGNDVEICVGGGNLFLFRPATRIKYGLDGFDLKKGTLNRSVEWTRPYTELVGGQLSPDGKQYVILQSKKRIPVKVGGFTTNWSTGNCELRMVDATDGDDLWIKTLGQEVQFGTGCKFSNDNKTLGVTSIPAKGLSHKLVDKFVAFYRTVDGKELRRCKGELLAFSKDGKFAIVRRLVKSAPSYRLIRVHLESGKEQELRNSPYSSFRFAHFDESGDLLVDVSAHKSSMHLDIEQVDIQSGKSSGHFVLPALNFNEKYSISPSGKTFARLTRNGTNDCRIEIYDLNKSIRRQSLEFKSDTPQNKGHMISDLILIDDDRIATGHPLVIWKD